MKISVIGTGAYGIALALQLAKKGDNKICMWTESDKISEEYATTLWMDLLIFLASTISSVVSK